MSNLARSSQGHGERTMSVIVEVSLSTAGYDVIVVGAGPAGSVAALVLARAGARVGLVDKAGIGRDKACGDLIGPRGVRLLDDLGLTVPGAPISG